MSSSDWREERHPVGIEPTDIDHMGHVNNAVYLRWVQEAVLAHWARIAPVEAHARHLWVALRHEITYRRAAFLGDELSAVALLRSARGARASYHTLIKRGEELLAEAISDWCSVDATTRRPLKLPGAIVERARLCLGA